MADGAVDIKIVIPISQLNIGASGFDNILLAESEYITAMRKLLQNVKFSNPRWRMDAILKISFWS